MSVRNGRKVAMRLSAAMAVTLLGISLTGCAAEEKANVILSTSQGSYSAVVSTEASNGNSMDAHLEGPLALKVGDKTYNVGDKVNFAGGFGKLNKESLKVAGTCALETEPFFIHTTAN